MNRRLIAALVLTACMTACAAPPLQEIPSRPLTAAEIRVHTQHRNTQVLTHRSVGNESVLLISESAQVGYERLTVQTLTDARGTITPLGRETVLPVYDASGLLLMDDKLRNNWLALFVDPSARATRVLVTFSQGEPINEAISFDAALLVNTSLGEQDSTGFLAVLDSQGQEVRSGVIRFDGPGQQWRLSKN